MEEIWKDIIGYEGLYQVSNTGKVKSLERCFYVGKWEIKTSKIIVKEKLIKISTNKDGYVYVSLSKKGSKLKKVKMHRLMAIYFIPNPNNYEQVNHINAIRNDFRIENLEWCTHSHNMKHKFIIGNESHARGKNVWAKPVLNTETGIYYECATDAAECHNIELGKLYRMLSGRQFNETNLKYPDQENARNPQRPKGARMIKCIESGKIYKSAKEAAMDKGVTFGSIHAMLRGYRKNTFNLTYI